MYHNKGETIRENHKKLMVLQGKLHGVGFAVIGKRTVSQAWLRYGKDSFPVLFSKSYIQVYDLEDKYVKVSGILDSDYSGPFLRVKSWKTTNDKGSTPKYKKAGMPTEVIYEEW